VKYTWIKQHAERIKISHLCGLLNIKRSSYYSWLSVLTISTQRKTLDNQLKPLIKEVYEQYRGSAGAPRIKAWLFKHHGKVVSRRRIYRLLKELDLKVKQIKKFRNKDVSHINDTRIAKNELNRHFNAIGPNQKWVSDITYIKTKKGWMFLVVFIDLYSRRIVGWAADTHMRAELVTRALLMAILNQKTK